MNENDFDEIEETSEGTNESDMSEDDEIETKDSLNLMIEEMVSVPDNASNFLS
jgi:hypothetical protein